MCVYTYTCVCIYTHVCISVCVYVYIYSVCVYKCILYIYGFAGSDSSDAKTGGVFFSGKPAVRRAMALADGVMFDSPEKRLKMPVCMEPSDDDDDEEEEDMEVTL